MSNPHWPLVPLGDLLTRNEKLVALIPDQQYREVTIRLWGKGVVLRQIVNGADIASQRRSQVSEDQFIVSRIDARNGAMGLVPTELDGAVVTNDFPTFNVNRERLLPAFLGWLCRTKSFVDTCRSASEGTTNRVRLKEERFMKQEIRLPPLKEQQRIVCRLDSLVSKVEEAKTIATKAASEIQVLKKVLLLQCEKLALELGKPIELEGLVEHHDSGWSPQCGDLPAKLGEWGVLKTTCVQWDGFDFNANKALLEGMAPKQNITVIEGDLLITRAGPVNRVGVASVVRDAPPNLMLSVKIVRLQFNPRVLPEFIALMTETPVSQEYLRKGKTGLAESQVNIARTMLLKLPIPVPSLADQQQIVEQSQILHARLNKVLSLQIDSKRAIDAMLTSILDSAFKGAL